MDYVGSVKYPLFVPRMDIGFRFIYKITYFHLQIKKINKWTTQGFLDRDMSKTDQSPHS